MGYKESDAPIKNFKSVKEAFIVVGIHAQQQMTWRFRMWIDNSETVIYLNTYTYCMDILSTVAEIPHRAGCMVSPNNNVNSGWEFRLKKWHLYAIGSSALITLFAQEKSL